MARTDKLPPKPLPKKPNPFSKVLGGGRGTDGSMGSTYNGGGHAGR